MRSRPSAKLVIAMNLPPKANPDQSRKTRRTKGAANPRTRMLVGIFGLGHVGLITVACLRKRGIRVEGYEISKSKRVLLNRGASPIIEPEVQPYLGAGRGKRPFCAKIFPEANELPDIILICVGTPSAADGSTDLNFVLGVFEKLARFARKHPRFRSEVILRSTVPPGTLAEIQARHPDLFARVPVAFHPEFLREGTAMKDFFEPQQSIIGLPPSGLRPEKMLQLLTQLGLGRSLRIVSAITAESLKFACNAYHAVKVSFANEVARFVTACGGDAVEVMDLFCQDTKLNISSKYLRPGSPYGGSCLRKDTRSMAALGERLGVKLELIKSCEASNHDHLESILAAIRRHRPGVVALLGLAFKKQTDDLRGSPSVDLLRRLTADGTCAVWAHDFLMRPSWEIELRPPSRNSRMAASGFVLCQSLDQALSGADLAVIMHDDRRYQQAGANFGIPVLDVAGWREVRP
jgi:GDP-mannose 6-dehydrogenase